MSGELAAVLSALCWALTSSMMRELTPLVPSLALNALRSVIGLIFNLGIAMITGRLLGFADITAGNLLFLTINLSVGMLLGDTVYYSSMRMIGVSRALTLSSVYPLTTAVLGALFLGERFGVWTYVGFVVCVVGVVLVAQSGLVEAKDGPSSNARRGVAFALAAALCWSVGAVSLRQGAEGLDPYVINSIRMLGVGVMAGGLASRTHQFRSVPALKPKHGLLLLVASVLGSVVGSVLYLVAIQTVGASKTAVLASVAPLFSVPLAMLGGERPGLKLVTGVLLAVAGVALVVA